MKRLSTYRACMVLLAPMTCATAGQANGQSYPFKPIRMIVPYTSGGGVDIVARAMAQKMSEGLGQSVVIDNRAGAGSSLGLALGARATPDGYTIVMASSAMTINPSIYKVTPYDPVRDFAPISLASVLPLVLVVSPSVPAASVRDLIALAKARKGRLTCASSGIGNSTHLAMELFSFMTQAGMIHVPYKTTAQKNMDLMGGQVDLMFAAIPSVMPQVRAGQMRALAVSSATRSSVLPDIPTIAEAGVPGYDFVTWNGVIAPAGTRPDILLRLNGEIGKALAHPEVKARLVADGAEPAASSPAEFAAYIKTEIAKYARVVAAAGIPKE